MNISYLITIHNEEDSLDKLLNLLCENIGDNDEIIMLDDYSTNEKTVKIINKFKLDPNVFYYQTRLNGDFSKHKNFGGKRCTKDFVCQLDADEYLSQPLLENIHEIIESNPTVELYRVPRVNIVRGATESDARNWGWHITKLPEFGDLPIINWGSGDYQSRIYKNSLKIQWQKPLHETIMGAAIVAHLPKEVDYSIIHDKTIDRQRAQNEFYNKNWSINANMGQG